MYYNRLFKIISASILLISCMVSSQPMKVYAGDINGEEARLLEYVNKTFEQDGISYKVNQAYKTKLRKKLTQDDVDLTTSDVEMIIAGIDYNVATGVENGYLVPTEEEEQEANEVPDTEESQAGEETAPQGTNQEEGMNGSETETNGKATDTTSEVGTSQGTTNTTADEDTSQESTNTSSDKNEVQDSSETLLKNTGYSLKSIPYLAASMGILMILGILSVFILNYVEVLNETKK